MGIIRLLLAIAVVGAHTGHPFMMGGREAVTIFYQISGFLMALILNKTYLNHLKGFYLNRVLRLMVPYWAVLVLMLLLLMFSGMPHPLLDSRGLLSIYGWLSNLFILGSDFGWLFGINEAGELLYSPYGSHSGHMQLAGLSLVLPIFTVSMEFYFYILAPFVVISMARSWLFLYLSLFYCIVITYLGLGQQIAWTYHFPLAPFVYFAFGVISCHFFILDRGKMTCRDYVLLFAGFTLFAYTDSVLSFPMLIATFFVLPLLFRVSRSSTTDRYIGNYSYPVYLLHYPVLTVLNYYGLGDVGLFYLTCAVSLLLSGLIHHYIEKPVETVRLRVRMAGKTEEAGAS
jgi:peptidoglycan/LPS O-acetylase OafA/YrhL